MNKILLLFAFLLIIVTVSISTNADQVSRDEILSAISKMKTADDVKIMSERVIDFISKEPELDYENDYIIVSKMIIKEMGIIDGRKSYIKFYQVMMDKYKFSDNYLFELMLERDSLCYEMPIPDEFVPIEENLLLNIEAESTLKMFNYHNNIVNSILKSSNKDKYNKAKEHLKYIIDFDITRFINNKHFKEICDIYKDASVQLVGMSSNDEIKKTGIYFIAIKSVSTAYPEKSKLIHWGQTPSYNKFLWMLTAWLNFAIEDNAANKELVDHFTYVYKYLEDEKFNDGLIDEKTMPMTVKNRTKMLATKKINKDADALYNKSVINFAIISSDIELVKMLLDKGISLDTKDIDGKLPLDYANENVKNKVPGSDRILALLNVYLKKK